MRMTLPILTVAALLAGCQPAESTPTDDGTTGVPATAEAGEAAAVPAETVADGEPRWMVSNDGENRYLAFALPESDDVRLTMSCGPNERFVRLWRETWDGDTPEFRLASGDVETSYPGEVTPEGMAPQLDGVAPARAPVFLAFRETGQLSLTVEGEAHEMSAQAGDLPEIDAFFTYCGPPGG